jgi:hypothetical protein
MSTVIECESLDQFLDVVAGLIQRGITFETQVGNFKVYLTGGF